jgi:hypothetical protein
MSLPTFHRSVLPPSSGRSLQPRRQPSLQIRIFHQILLGCLCVTCLSTIINLYFLLLFSVAIIRVPILCSYSSSLFSVACLLTVIACPYPLFFPNIMLSKLSLYYTTVQTVVELALQSVSRGMTNLTGPVLLPTAGTFQIGLSSCHLAPDFYHTTVRRNAKLNSPLICVHSLEHFLRIVDSAYFNMLCEINEPFKAL